MKNNKLYKLITYLKSPPTWFILIWNFLSLTVISGAIVMLAIGYHGGVREVFAYALFALSAVFFSYSVYTVIRFAPSAKRKIIRWAIQYDFLHDLIRDFGFRTVIFAIGSLALSIAFGLFNGVIGIISLSIWYGALAAYYIILAAMRGAIITYHNKKRKGRLSENSERELEIKRAASYRSSGVLIVLLTLALSVAVAQMLLSDKHFSYSGLMIYASATYAFYKITMSVVNFVKARRQDDMTVQAIRNINLADGMVSILALQTALLDTFGNAGKMTDIFNTITGIVVCASTLALGIIMTAKGNKRISELKNITESTNGE